VSSLHGLDHPVLNNLQVHCRAAQMHPPVFNIVSDRRGIPSNFRIPAQVSVTVSSSRPNPIPQPKPIASTDLPTPGGRTAWSSTVTIEGQHIAARYWYDGQYVNNAKEDAAEVALQQLTTPQSPQAQMPGQAQAWRLRGYSSVSSG